MINWLPSLRKPESTEGRREDSGRGVRELQGRWPGLHWGRAEELGAISPGRRVGTHTLRHSCARHLLVHGIPINYLSRWLGHSAIQTTLIYLELVPDPTGSLASVP